MLERRTTVTGGHPDHRTRAVVDEARVLLHQQRSEQCHADHAMNTAAFSIMEVGPHGVIERAIDDEILSFAPMQRTIRS